MTDTPAIGFPSNLSHNDELALAVNGGEAVRQSPMPLRAAIGHDERRMIAEVLDHYDMHAGDFGYQGIFEERYCAAFSDYMGGGYADAVATGTSAVFVALAALGLERGSEVLVSPITDPGTLSAIILNGLVPRLVDSSERSYNVSRRTVEEALSEKTRAAVLVHSAGRGIDDIDEIAPFLAKKGVALVEDCSQAHGARVAGKLVGTFGDIAAFSTMYRKAHVTGASGGVVYSKNEDLYRQALAHADRGKPRWAEGFNDRDPSTFLFPALNLHTDEISCAVGISSLARLDAVRRSRLEYVEAVCEGVAGIDGLMSYGYSKDDSPFFLPVLIDTTRFSVSKRQFADAVLAEGIPLNPHYQYCAAEWPWLQPYLSGPTEVPNAHNIIEISFNLYLNENYSSNESRDTLNALAKVANAYVLN